MAKVKKPDFENIKMLVIDVDGVMTDGSILISQDGAESKNFSILDGHGIKMWHRAGLKTALISGRSSKATDVRAEQLKIEHVFQGYHKKLEAFEELLAKTGFSQSEVAVIGDDVLDLPLIRRAGFGVAVANAVDELKQCADYITTLSGGQGAVREVIEYILKKSDRWQELMKRYLV